MSTGTDNRLNSFVECKRSGALRTQREEVLEHIDKHPEGQHAWQVSEALGMLITSARFHLTVLTQEGVLMEAGSVHYQPTNRKITVYKRAAT